MAPGLRVKWHTTAGQVVLAGNEACIGVTAGRATAAGQPIEILDIKSCGTLPFTAAGAIAAGAGFTSAANGKVASGAAGNEDYGVALTAATGDGAQFEGTSGL
ncbi:MAG: capsid cement protein [Planctomycetota bacterium]